ncbi:Ribosomal protein L22 bacterial/chloroplast-type [Penicillium mononematosum]|uniref:mitochondrial 54S ribosomal protein L22 n=1 Tax=Penicillium mononematosum TaxID=268346 RepID=UPI002546DF74|nr:mitochondrial 54S ribosomal protein L22 [Penicillium mononematosum]KAJ6178660.1 Ribosomal protein L22 bacterial/chloroplast-type [Penicillium mononematosum]
MLYRSGQLVRTAARTVSFVPRRTLTSTAVRYALNDGESKKSTGLFSSLKSMFTGGDSQKPKVAHRPSAPKKEEGDLGSSIFGSDFTAPTSGPMPSRKTGEQEKEIISGKLEDRDLSRLQVGLGPDPKAQLRWERKMAVREIRKRGRVPAKVQIKRTERESLSKSHWIKTSLKKLGPLARQIAGKNIDEAILQMRFSNKKAAKDVLEHLEHAKNVAIVRAGMGLGAANSEPSKPITVTLKTGERQKIANPTDIYIQQAWVNRGPYGYEMDHRARGQINRMRPPTTSLSVLLKEEKTRIREWEDREAKAQRERRSQLWTQLPDRKISAQNQYYSW